jgi:hypothetical protein
MSVSSTTKRLHLLEAGLQSHPKPFSKFSDSYYSLPLRQTYVNRTYEYVVSESVITVAAFSLQFQKSFHYAAIYGERSNISVERTQFNHRP